MLFGKRLCACQVVRRAGYKVFSPMGDALVRILVMGAKHSHRIRGDGPSDHMHVAFAAQALEESGEAQDHLARVYGGRRDIAGRLSQAAQTVSRENWARG